VPGIAVSPQSNMSCKFDASSFFAVPLRLSDLNSSDRPAAASEFLFCKGSSRGCSIAKKQPWQDAADDAKKDEKKGQRINLLVSRPSPRRSLWQDPEMFPGAVAFFVPAAAALAQQVVSGGSSGVALACLPIVVPFSIPQVSMDVWCADKRALAFHRATAILVHVQGGLAVLRFLSGDLVGGAYQGLQTALGLYAIGPEGMPFFPSYIMMSGFNGFIGGLGVIQNLQGVPFGAIPWAPFASPAVSLAVAYCGWQFCKEVYAIASGAELGEQDSCFVRALTPAWWPQGSSLAATTRPAEAEESHGASRFSAFAGSGYRLGQTLS